MKQSQNPTYRNRKLRLDMSPAEVFEHLSQKHKPLAPGEIRRVRQKLMRSLKESRGMGQLKNSRECEEILLHQVNLQGKLSPDELIISNTIVDFAMTRRSNHELRQYITINSDTGCTLNESDGGLVSRDFLDRETVLEKIKDYAVAYPVSSIERILDITKRDLLHEWPPVDDNDIGFLVAYVGQIALEERKKRRRFINERISNILYRED